MTGTYQKRESWDTLPRYLGVPGRMQMGKGKPQGIRGRRGLEAQHRWTGLSERQCQPQVTRLEREASVAALSCITPMVMVSAMAGGCGQGCSVPRRAPAPLETAPSLRPQGSKSPVGTCTSGRGYQSESQTPTERPPTNVEKEQQHVGKKI